MKVFYVFDDANDNDRDDLKVFQKAYENFQSLEEIESYCCEIEQDQDLTEREKGWLNQIRTRCFDRE